VAELSPLILSCGNANTGFGKFAAILLSGSKSERD